MPTHSEVVRLNLEFYRKQAKALLRASKSGDSTAVQRMLRHTPKLNPSSQIPSANTALALHDAQFAIAREQGFLTWPRFKAFITESQLNFQELTAAFIDAAVSNGQRAREILAAHPQIAGAGFYVALVLGDSKQVEKVLTETPALTNEKSGPQNCEPLLYVCFSRFANGKSERAADLVETAHVLLRHGAAPSASLIDGGFENPLSCLYAASGLNNNPALTLLLLEAGANPNDGESVYHSTEHNDLTCLKLLLSHGATPKGTNALKHMLDREDIEGLQLLLAAEADPNETNERGETALHWAVWRGRNAKAIALLLDNGADIDAAKNDGRTAYALARLSGQTDIEELLAARGANQDLSAVDRYVAGFTAGQENRGIVPPVDIGLSPAAAHLLPALASVHRTSVPRALLEAVRALLQAGVSIDTRGEHGGTTLHWACWNGYDDLAELLLSHGASLTIEDYSFHAPPSGWLHHGVTNSPQRNGDRARIARLLIATGSAMQGCDTPTGDPKVDAVLREHELIE